MLALDPNSQHMPLAVLRKIRDLVNAGAVVVGPKPVDSPSLADDEAEFQTIADQLWGAGTGEHSGKGRSTAGSIADALRALNVAPDFEYTKPQADTELLFVHRSARRRRHLLGEQPERPRRGRSRRPSASRARRRSSGTPTRAASSRRPTGSPAAAPPCRCSLEPNDAVFVVFRKAATAPSRTVAGDRWRRRSRHVDGSVGRRVPAGPRRAGQGHARRARVRGATRRRRREVLLRHRHLHQDHPGAGGLVHSRRASCGSIWATSRTSPRSRSTASRSASSGRRRSAWT